MPHAKMYIYDSGARKRPKSKMPRGLLWAPPLLGNFSFLWHPPSKVVLGGEKRPPPVPRYIPGIQPHSGSRGDRRHRSGLVQSWMTPSPRENAKRPPKKPSRHCEQGGPCRHPTPEAAIFPGCRPWPAAASTTLHDGGDKSSPPAPPPPRPLGSRYGPMCRLAMAAGRAFALTGGARGLGAPAADCLFPTLTWPSSHPYIGIVPPSDALSVAFEWASVRAYGWGGCCSPWPPSCLPPLVSESIRRGQPAPARVLSMPLPHISLSPHIPPITPHTPLRQTAAILTRAGPRPPRMPTTAGTPAP